MSELEEKLKILSSKAHHIRCGEMLELIDALRKAIEQRTFYARNSSALNIVTQSHFSLAMQMNDAELLSILNGEE